MNRIRLKYLAAEPITNGLGLSGAFDNVDWPRYIRTTDIRDERTLRDDVFASQPPSVAAGATVKPRDLLMTAAGATIGKSYLHYDRAPACYAGYLARLRPKPGVDERYISYWMQSTDYWAQIDAGAVRSTIDNFSAGKYRQLSVPMLPLEDQRRIADFLDDQVARIDEIVRLREEQVEAVEARSDGYTDAVLMSAAVGTRRLRPLLLVLRDGTHTPPTRVADGVPLLTAKNLRSNQLRFSPNDTYITEEDADALDRSLRPISGDVLLSIKGTVGKVAVVRGGLPRFQIERNTALFRPRVEEVSSEWLYWALRTRYVQDQLLLSMGFSAQPGIYLGSLAAIQIPLPGRDHVAVTDSIQAAATSAVTAAAEMQSQIDLLQERKRSLITAAVTGEFDVTTASGRGVA